MEGTERRSQKRRQRWRRCVAAARPAWRVLKEQEIKQVGSTATGCSVSTRMEGTESANGLSITQTTNCCSVSTRMEGTERNTNTTGGTITSIVAESRPAWRVLKAPCT